MSDENSRKSLEEMDFENPKSGLAKLISNAKNKWIQLTMNPRFIGALLLAGLVGWALVFTLRSHRLQEREELGRVRMNLIKLQQSLLIPSEIIYYDPNRRMDLVKARIKGYEYYGVEGILPYKMVQNPGLGSAYYPQVEEGPLEYANGNLEQWWMNHSGRACGQLISEIENEEGLGNYLKQNPALFDAHIQPLIVRMLDSVWAPCRITACEVLLAMGDRSEEVLEILILSDYFFASRDGSFLRDRIFEEYGIDQKAVDAIIPKDKADHNHLTSWKRTYEIVKELKKKYPLKPETVIRDWESYCFDGRE